jgi:hypothetical protein
MKLEGWAKTSTRRLEKNARGTPLIGVTFTWLSQRYPQHNVIIKVLFTSDVCCLETTDSQLEQQQLPPITNIANKSIPKITVRTGGKKLFCWIIRHIVEQDFQPLEEVR